MANLILTTECQRNCSYCFAKNSELKTFTWDDFLTVIDFLDSNHRTVNLLGGEPTLHPKFIDMLKYLIEKDFYIQVFTNGMLSEKKVDQLIKLLNTINIEKEQLFFAININEKKYRSEKENILQSNFMKKINKITYPAFTIHEDIDLSFLSNIINKYNLDRNLRIGTANPILNENNKYLNKNLYNKVAKNIVNFVKNNPDINIKLDCGFPLCVFNIDDLEILYKNKENEISFICGQPLDIYPDLMVSNCYSLSKLCKVDLRNFKNISEIQLYFQQGFMLPTGTFSPEKCKTCSFFRKICFGGCKGFNNINKKGDDK